MKTALGCLLVLFCLAGFGLSGQTLGEIAGLVTDASGAVVSGATVTMTNTGTAAVREAKTNEFGLFSFPALTPGLYNAKVSATGFKTTIRNGVLLEVQQNLRLDFELTVGQVTESIEVSAAAAQLTTENSTVGTVIENKRIVDLPLNGRNALSLAALSPNVSFGFPSAGQAGNRQGGIRADRSISIGGQRSQFNHFTLDGVENTDPNFNTYVVEPSVDALAGIQGPDRRVPGRVRPRDVAGEHLHQGGDQRLSRRRVLSFCATRNWTPRTTPLPRRARPRTLSS